MIDFEAIKDRISRIERPIGGEHYITLKGRKNLNVYNEFDKTGNTLLNGDRNLLLYQTDKTFDEGKLWLLNHYDRIFSVNCVIDGNDRIIKLPLGMVDNGESINFALCYKSVGYSMFDLIRECRDEYRGNPRKLIYLNYRISDKSQTDRINSASLTTNLDDGEYTNEIYVGNKWLLFNGRERAKEYYMKCLNHMFVACPRGFGIDTYRFYETLYLGRIPVVLHNPVTDMFKDLPVLFLDDWCEFKTKSTQFIGGFDIDKYDFSKLTRQYWYNVITKYTSE